MQIHIFALSLMVCISFSAAFHRGGNLPYHLGTFNTKKSSSVAHTHIPASSLANRAFYGPAGRARSTAMNMMKSDCSSNHNYFFIRFLGLASFAMFSCETMAQAFVPDLSGSPLKNAPPTIVVEGVPRVVDGVRQLSYPLVIMQCTFLNAFSPLLTLSLQGILS
jgi:hypothetical protein